MGVWPRVVWGVTPVLYAGVFFLGLYHLFPCGLGGGCDVVRADFEYDAYETAGPLRLGFGQVVAGLVLATGFLVRPLDWPYGLLGGAGASLLVAGIVRLAVMVPAVAADAYAPYKVAHPIEVVARFLPAFLLLAALTLVAARRQQAARAVVAWVVRGLLALFLVTLLTLEVAWRGNDVDQGELAMALVIPGVFLSWYVGLFLLDVHPRRPRRPDGRRSGSSGLRTPTGRGKEEVLGSAITGRVQHDPQDHHGRQAHR